MEGEYCDKISRFEVSIYRIYSIRHIIVYITGRYPVGSGTPYQILLDQQWKLRVLNEELINISFKAQQAIARSRKLEVQGDFASFPVPPLAKVRDYY